MVGRSSIGARTVRKYMLLYVYIDGFGFFSSLELVNGALQRYRTIVRQRNIAQYDPVYPLIASYVEQVAKVLKQ